MLEIFKKKVKNQFKTIYFRILTIYFTFHPFKVYEFKELMKHTKISKSDVILDIGCGEGLQTLILGIKCKKIYGIDINKRWLSIARLRSYYKKNKINSKIIFGKLENLNFQDNYFDKIFSICVLEHISNYLNVLEEIYRILKKGGQLLLSVDSLTNIEDNSIKEIHKKKFYVYNYFNKNQLKSQLQKIGFKKIQIYSIFHSNYAKKLFIKEVKFGNHFGYIKSIFLYLILKFKERSQSHQKPNNGLFLIAICFK